MSVELAVALAEYEAVREVLSKAESTSAGLAAAGSEPEQVQAQIAIDRVEGEAVIARRLYDIRRCHRHQEEVRDLISLGRAPPSTLDRLAIEAEYSLRKFLNGDVTLYERSAAKDGVPLREIEVEAAARRLLSEARLIAQMPYIRNQLLALTDAEGAKQ